MSEVSRFGMVIDLGRCLGCSACVAACITENLRNKTEKAINEGAEAVSELKLRTQIKEIDLGEYPAPNVIFFHELCRHCENPPCVSVCPTGASYKTEEGVVLVNHELCIGCKYCMTACPYNARYIHEELRTPDKCTFCYHRVRKGELPACVEVCPSHARIFGDLDDPTSEVSRLVSEGAVPAGAEYGTKPKVFYIPPVR